MEPPPLKRHSGVSAKVVWFLSAEERKISLSRSRPYFSFRAGFFAVRHTAPRPKRTGGAFDIRLFTLPHIASRHDGHHPRQPLKIQQHIKGEPPHVRCVSLVLCRIYGLFGIGEKFLTLIDHGVSPPIRCVPPCRAANPTADSACRLPPHIAPQVSV